LAAGLARLGTVVKEIREEHPGAIVLAPVRLSPTVRTATGGRMLCLREPRSQRAWSARVVTAMACCTA